MNDVSGLQLEPGCNLGVPDIAAAEALADFKQFGPCGIVNGSVDPAAAKKRSVCGVHHALNIQFRNVCEYSSQDNRRVWHRSLRSIQLALCVSDHITSMIRVRRPYNAATRIQTLLR